MSTTSTTGSGGGKRRIALVVISDRRDLYIEACLKSLETYLTYPLCQKVIVADPDHKYTASSAVHAGWEAVQDADFIWHMEEDFVLTQPVDIEGMCRVLDANQDLAHLVLLRQPWSQPEVDAGGIIPLYAEHMVDRDTAGYPWVQHDRFFSLNPSLVPRRVFELGFPEGSEPAMTQQLLDKGFHFGYWGARHDNPRCLHIGETRSVGSVR